MLQSFCSFFWAYVDDIIVFFCILKKHLKHLTAIFKILIWKFISLFSNKSFLDYSMITLLNQHVDALRLSTSKEKLAVILQLQFSKTLKQLETYLNLTKWLRNYMLFYAQIVTSLQLQKIMLLHDSFIKEKSCKFFFIRTDIAKSSSKKLKIFKMLQL